MKYQYSIGMRHRTDNMLFTFGVTENLQNVNNTPDIGFQLGFAFIHTSFLKLIEQRMHAQALRLTAPSGRGPLCLQVLVDEPALELVGTHDLTDDEIVRPIVATLSRFTCERPCLLQHCTKASIETRPVGPCHPDLKIDRSRNRAVLRRAP